MKQTLMVKLDPSKEQHQAILETMHRFNEACNYIADIAFKMGTANKIEIQKVVYYDVRDKFKLSAQLTIRAIAKVSEAYKRDKSIKPKFKPTGAIVYDQRILSFRKLEAISILTNSGRLIIPIRIGEYQKVRLDRIRGQADLIYRGKIFYLAVVVEVPEPSKADAAGYLGIDLGIVYLATDDEGETFSGKQIDQVREKNAKLRANLAGIPVILVDPRGTSHICPECGHNEKRNRPNRDTFRCVQCGFCGNADHIAAINIAARAAVNQPIIACDEVKAIIGIEMEHSYKPLSGAFMPPISIGGN